MPTDSAPDAAPRVAAERVLAGRYRLVGLIAEGGMAQVWEGHDAILDRPVAVKVLRSHLAGDEAFRERFRREAVAAARLSHPGVVATYDTGVDDGVAYIVMELVRGTALRELLVPGRPIPADQARRIAADVADALDYAHRAGVVHRDVKPGNILVVEDGRVKVADFGIAKAAETDRDLTQVGTLLGTAKYLAPEQIEGGHSVDGRADIYSLGVVLYELLAGEAPFSADSDLALALQRLRSDPAPLTTVRPDVPVALATAVERAMAREVTDRFQTAGDFGQALRAVPTAPAGPRGDARPGVPAPGSAGVPGLPPEATPPAGVAGLPPRRRRRSRTALASGILLLAGLAAAVALFGATGPGQRLLGRRTHRGVGGNGGTSLPVAKTLAFDPPPRGDGEEHNELLGNLVDGDRSTFWRTEHYNDRHFGNLKDGVGFILELDHPRRLGHLVVTTSGTPGWAASIYLAPRPPQPGTALADWGRPAATVTNAPDGDVTVNLKGHDASDVLVWFTDLGEGNQFVKIGEARLSG